MIRIIFSTLLILAFSMSMLQGQDWANLSKFQAANEALGAPKSGEKRVVFMGNSITEGWSNQAENFFDAKGYINRGISGQTTPQMLVRFRQDVVALQPEVVVILAGINDIAGNTGPSTIPMIADNIKGMAEIARANSIKVVISSVLPAYDFPWRPGLEPAEKVIALNEILKKYAKQNRIVYLDYFSTMVDERKGMKQEYTYDEVHCTKAGYDVMTPLAEAAIAKAMKRRK